MVVVATADVVVEQDWRLWSVRRGFVGAVLEDSGDRFVGTGIEQEGRGAGGVDPA
jgi:hypothetical protein